MRNITVSQPEAPFQPVTIVIHSKTELANLLGALVAYGTGKVYAENSLKAIGLGDYYSGNIRKAAREMATQIAEASGVVPLPDFSSYLNSSKYMSARTSKAGAAVAGTEEDLSNGREYSTTFEDAEDAEAEIEDGEEELEVEVEVEPSEPYDDSYDDINDGILYDDRW